MKHLWFCLPFLLLMCHRAYSQPTGVQINTVMNTNHISGANISVVKNGKLIWVQAAGLADRMQNRPVNRHTPFMIGSISKTIMATAVMQLWERGQLNLDADINTYLPFPVRNPHFPNAPISLRHLLTHTSSLIDNGQLVLDGILPGDAQISLDSALRSYFVPGGANYNVAINFATTAPGTAYSYSNFASSLAALMVEHITGDDFAHYCDTAIFQKLCMEHTGYRLANFPDTNQIARCYYYDGSQYVGFPQFGFAIYPVGALRTTAAALARFTSMMMQHGQFEGTRLLKASTVDTMLTPQLDSSKTMGQFQGLIFYGLPIGTTDTLWGHDGRVPGGQSLMHFSLAHQLGTIVLTNTDENPAPLFNLAFIWGDSYTPTATDTFPACGLEAAVAKGPASKQTLAAFPNPASESMSVSGLSEGMQLSIFDLAGRCVLALPPATGQSSTLSLAALQPGMYLLRTSGSQGTASMRIVKQ